MGALDDLIQFNKSKQNAAAVQPTVTAETKTAGAEGVPPPPSGGYEEELRKLEARRQELTAGLDLDGAAQVQRQIDRLKKDNGVSFWQRAGNTLSGAGKQSAASWGDGMAAAYELGQTARDEQNRWYESEHRLRYDQAERGYRMMLEDNEAKPGSWSQGDLEGQLNVMADAKRKLDAMGVVIGEKLQQRAADTARDTTYQLAQSGGADVEKAKEGLGAGGRLLVDVGVAGTQLATDAAANYLLFGGLKTPGGKLRPASTVGAKLSMGGRVFGGSTMEAREGGASVGRQVGYGAAMTALELLTEKIGDGLDAVYGEGATSEFTDELISKLSKTEAGQKALRLLFSAGGEGAEELVSGVVSPALQSIYDGKAATGHYSVDTLTDAAYSALVGSVLGGVGGAAEVGGGYKPSDNLTAALFGKGTQTNETPAVSPQDAAGVRTEDGEGVDTTTEQNAAEGTQTKDALVTALFGQGKENAASVPEAASKYDAVQAEVIRREGKTFRNLVAGFDTKVSDFFSKWKTGRTNAGGEKLEKLYLGKLSDPVRAQVSDILGYAVDERDVIVTNDDVKHIFDHHGDAQTEAQNGNIPLEQWMFDALPDIVTDPDDVSKGNIGKGKKNAGKQAVLFSKAFPGGTVVTVQFDNKGRKTMEIVTLYAKNKGATSELYAPAEADASAVRPGRSEPAPIVDTTIPQPADSVNSAPEAQGESDHTNTVGAAEAGFALAMQEDAFGKQEGGEKAVRPDHMPRKVAGPDPNGDPTVENVSRTAVTVKGAKVTPDDFVPLMQNEVMDTETPSGLRYMPITNNETTQKAMDTIMDKGWVSALADWTAKVRSGQNSPVETAIGALLYNHAVNSGDAGLALDVLSDYAANVRNAAQSLQAARILKTMTPDNRLYMIRRSLSRMMADGKVPENITIGQDLETEYLNAKSEQERDAALTKIQESVAAQWPGSWMEKWTALRYVNMLGNFKTQARNLLGNVGMWTMRKVHNAAGAGLEQIAHMASGGKFERTRSLTAPRALSKAARADFDNVKAIAMGEQKYGDLNAETNEFMRGVQDKREIFRLGNDPVSKLLALPGKIPVAGKAYSAALRGAGTAAEGYRKATNWAMNNQWFGDEGFSRAAYGRALAGWLKAHGITAEQFSDPKWQAENAQTVGKGRQFAVKEAQEATYRDSNTLSEWVSRIGRRSDTPKAVKMAAEGLSPFRKTPANVLVRAEEYSLLGLVNTAVQAFRATDPNGEITGADIINSLSKSLTGTGLFLAGMALRAKGLLRGGSEDDEEQAAFDDLTGHQDYSLELPDGTSITLDWASPLSMPLFMGVQLEDLRQDKNVSLKDLEQALTSLAEPMLEMSMMQGISDTLDDLRYSESYNLFQLAGSAALNYVTQGMTNSLVSHISQSMRDKSLMTYVDKESPVPAWLQRELGTASRKWPGEGYNQIPYIDAWGREEETGDPIERSVRNLFSPAYLSKVEVDEVEQELQRLYDKTGEGGVLPDRAEKSFEVDGETKQLTADEYVKYAKAKGQNSYKLVQRAVSSAAYKSMSNSQKAEFVSAMYGYANYKAKKAVAPKYENTTYAKYAEAERAGMSPTEYFLMRENIDADGSNKQGTPTKAEAKTYLDGQTKLSQSQKADLWDLIQRTDAWAKANPYRK